MIGKLKKFFELPGESWPVYVLVYSCIGVLVATIYAMVLEVVLGGN